MAGRAVRTQTDFSGLHLLLYAQLVSLRHGSRSRRLVGVSRAAGDRWRRAAAVSASDPYGQLSAGQARPRFLSVRRDGDLRSRDRTDTCGMDHGQLLLAIDCPHQPAGRSARARPRLSPCRRIRPISLVPRTSGVRVDYVGFALLAVGVGALQVMLDRAKKTIGSGRALSLWPASA